MSFKTSLILFAIFMVAGLSGYLAVRNGSYPVTVVNFRMITANELTRDSLTAQTYFKNDFRARSLDQNQLDTPQSQLEIKRAVLDNLISNLLVIQELHRRLKNDYQSVAENKIAQVLKVNQNLELGIKTLYGIEFPEFKERILRPQAYREILEGRMFLNNENFDDWLKNARARATVIILSPNLQWQNGELKLLN